MDLEKTTIEQVEDKIKQYINDVFIKGKSEIQLGTIENALIYAMVGSINRIEDHLEEILNMIPRSE